MKKAHMLRDGKHITCKKDSAKKGKNLSWDISIPNADICITCFNHWSKSGDHFMACIDHPYLVKITALEMSKVNMLSV